MFRRLKTLTLMQLSEKMDLSFLSNRGRMWAKLAIKTGLFIIITLVIMQLIKFFQGLMFITIDIEVIKAIIFFTQIIALITCTFGLIRTLYISKDNTILLSLPTKHSEIFVSKLIVYYLYEIRKNILLLLPIYLGYGLHFSFIVGFGFSYLLKVLLLTIIIPLFPVLIGALLSIPLMFIIHFLKRHPFSNILVVGVLIIIAFFGVSSLVGVITKQEHLRLQVFVAIVRDGVNNVIPIVNRWSLIYNQLQAIAFSGNNFQYLLNNALIVFGVIAVLIILVFSISMPTYFRLATHAFETTSKRKHQSKMEQNKNGYMIFLKKELKTFFRSSEQLVSNFIYLLILPFLIYLLNLIYQSLKISAFGKHIVIGVNILIGLILLMASNIASATALSREGSEFYLLKTAPMKTSIITWAKITVNFVFSSVVVIITTIALGMVGILEVSAVFNIGIVLLLINTGHIFWSYELDLMNPKMFEFAQTQSVDDNPNATKSILIGTAIAFLSAAILVALLFEDYKSGWLRMILMALAFLGARLYLLINKINVYFETIE